MGITNLEEYATAVESCLKVAQKPTGAGKITAQVLLSAFDGETYQLDVAALCNLDRNIFESAVTVIRGRYDTNREPHEMVAKGDAIFRDLCRQWDGLKLIARAKSRAKRSW